MPRVENWGISARSGSYPGAMPEFYTAVFALDAFLWSEDGSALLIFRTEEGARAAAREYWHLDEENEQYLAIHPVEVR